MNTDPIKWSPLVQFFCLLATVTLLVPSLYVWAVAQTGTDTTGPSIRTITDASGSRLQVDGRDFMVFGMNWGFIPVGENHLYSLWNESDEFIEVALEREMSLLKSMGVNTIRQYAGIPARWIRYIYERYGIYTILNHPMARYGFTIDGVWTPRVDYSDRRLRQAVTDEILTLVEQYRDTPGLLMWLLGNENNYGLSWTSFEIEALPEGEQDAARARQLYSLFGEITTKIKQLDPDHPVAIANGDLQYIDIIAEECKDLDILGSNVYRGISARDFFQVVKDKLGIPAMFTEFGADAWNAKEMREDQVTQARYLLGQWQEIYEQSAGKGRVGNSIGGIIFQWSDGWWKFGQDSRLEIHDTNASWPNAGYPEDYREGDNNMNEEWWGVCAKGPRDPSGQFPLYPRVAYFALQRAFELDPYAPGTDLAAIRAHFGAIDPIALSLLSGSDQGGLESGGLSPVRMTNLRIDLRTYSTGGSNISTPDADSPQSVLPSYLGFDHLESFYLDFLIQPVNNLIGTMSFNLLGHVPINPIDEIYYENRGRQRILLIDDQPAVFEGLERVKVYHSTVDWDDRWFQLNAFYRTGHTHWGYEGDFFGLYRDAFYGENIDIYNAEAPVGVEISGKRNFEGLKLAFGPQVWWGANPSLYLKYQWRLGDFDFAGIFHEDLASQSSVSTSSVVPLPPTRRATLMTSKRQGPALFEVGGIVSGATKDGEEFQVAEETADTVQIFVDTVKQSDALGAKAKVTVETGRFRWYGQAAYQGIVAVGGPIYPITFTGWRLKDSGWGNQTNLISGLTYNIGNFQIGPNFLFQKPIVGPMPNNLPPPGRKRNVLDDPFAVRVNRETVGAEVMIAYDPTPATWLFAWDNDIREDARLAWTLNFVYRHLPTTLDAAIGVLADGQTFPFPESTPPRDLWEVYARIVSRMSPNARLVAHLYGGTGEPNGGDQRLVTYYGGDARVTWSSIAFDTHVKFNYWGPYDFDRDFNLTYPLQLMGDISYTLGAPRWFGYPQTRMGIRTTWRSLDIYSPRYCPGGIENNPDCILTPFGPKGTEWEIRTYLQVSV